MKIKGNANSANSRLRLMAHYVCAKCEPSQLGATKLNKTLWIADTVSYRVTGKTISKGTMYVKQKFGPVPKHIMQALADLKSDGAIVTREVPFFGKTKREFVSLREPNPKDFSKEEREILDYAIKYVCENNTAISISNETHDVIWDAAEIGEEIPVFAVFAANRGKVTLDQRRWADKLLNKKHKQKQAA